MASALKFLRRLITSPTFRRSFGKRVVEVGRGRLKGHPGVRFGRGVKLTGPGRYVLTPGCSIRSGARIFVAAGATLEVATGASIGDRCVINVAVGVRIGTGTQISWQSQILDTDFHEVYRADGGHGDVSAPVVIGDQVLIGTGSMILKGVSIGDGAVVGAGSVVASDVAAKTVVLGNPARRVAEISGWK